MGMLRRKAWAAADAAALGEKGGVKTMNSIMNLPVYVFLGES